MRTYLFIVISGVIVAETATREEKRDMMAQFRAAGKEGIVFKHLREKWQPGRPASGGNALKCKFWASCSCVAARITPFL